MTSVAVVAHAGKSVAGGLPELRRVLAGAGVDAPLWYEVPKSRKAPEEGRAGGRRRCRPRVRLGRRRHRPTLHRRDGDRRPAFRPCRSRSSPPAPRTCSRRTSVSRSATFLPPCRSACTGPGAHRCREDQRRALRRHGRRGLRRADDPRCGQGAQGPVRAARVLLDRRPQPPRPRSDARVSLDGKPWFRGKVSCVLVGNVGKLTAGLEAFPDASPDDGRLDVGVVTASGARQWARALARLAAGTRRRFAIRHRGARSKIDVRFQRALPYELDGGARSSERRLKIKVRPAAVTVCVPRGAPAMSTAQRVPETFELTGDDARETLLRTGRKTLVRDAFSASATPTGSVMPGRSRLLSRSWSCRQRSRSSGSRACSAPATPGAASSGSCTRRHRGRPATCWPGPCNRPVEPVPHSSTSGCSSASLARSSRAPPRWDRSSGG